MDLDSAINDKPAEGATATDILRADHREVSRLFGEFKRAGAEQNARRVSANTICMQLELHDRIERDVFYPALRRAEPALVDAALRDHDEIRRLTDELRRCGDDEARRDDLMTRLRPVVEKHVNEEEQNIFPAAERAGVAGRDVGATLIKRKEELTRSTESLEGPAT
jgi:hemerythrin superfamily protein